MRETERYPTGLASDVYQYTGREDRLRKLIVDLHVWIGEGECLREPHEDARGPRRFKKEVREALETHCYAWRDPEDKAPWEMDLCGQYHRHEATRVCA